MLNIFAMNITNKKEIEKVVSYLKDNANALSDFSLRYAMLNVGLVLEQALGEYKEDDLHPHITLSVIEQPNALDVAESECCTTDCPSYRYGACTYLYKDKWKCPIINNFLVKDE